MAVVRHALRLVVVLGTVLAAAGAAAQDVRPSAIPDFDAVAAGNRGFGGFYVAGGLGYGLPAHRDFTIVDGFACPGAGIPFLGPVSIGGGSGCRTSAGLAGLTAHVLAGWNAGGPNGWISGLEFRGRLGREGGTGRLGGSTLVAIPGLSTYTNTAAGTYRASLDGGLAVTGRWGYAFSGFMPFLRAGLGVAQLTEQVDFDATGSRSCSLGPPVSCTTGGRVASRTSRWLPSAVFGAGIEVPIGRAFVRLDGEVEAVFSPSQNLLQNLAGQTLVTATGTGTGATPGTVGQASLRSENWIVSRRIMLSGGFRF
jgi:opacity protein-like surface antigen